MRKNTPKKEKKYSHLGLAEREEIAIGVENGMKQLKYWTVAPAQFPGR